MLVVAAFDDPDRARAAFDRLRWEHPAELLSREPLDAVPGEKTGLVPAAAVIGALLGSAISLAVGWYSTSLAYPLDIGGRIAPTFQSYPPAAIAVGMFWSALFATVAFLWRARLPRLHHPLFDASLHSRLSHGTILLSVEVRAEQASAIVSSLVEAGAADVECVST